MQHPHIWKTTIEKFTPQDRKDLKNAIYIIGKIAKHGHFGLGMRTVFMLSAVLGFGAVLQVGEKGVGKTTVIRAIEEWARASGIKVWSQEQTMAGADESMNDAFSNHRVLWVSHDLAKLSPTVQQGVLKVVAALSQDRNCTVKTSMYFCNIINCDLAWLGALAHDLYERLWQIPEWRGSYVDRILPFFCLPYRKQVTTRLPIIPRVQNSSLAKCDRKLDSFWEVVKLFEMHFGDERAQDYAARYMRGLARLNHRKFTTNADAKFLKMFRINIEAERIVGSRETYTSPLDVDTDALYLLSECLKHTTVNVPELNKKTKIWQENENMAYEIAADYPEFFLSEGETITASPKFKREQLFPQRDFEELCVRTVS